MGEEGEDETRAERQKDTEIRKTGDQKDTEMQMDAREGGWLAVPSGVSGRALVGWPAGWLGLAGRSVGWLLSE